MVDTDNTERGISDLSPLFENTQLRTLIAGHNLKEVKHKAVGVPSLRSVP